MKRLNAGGPGSGPQNGDEDNPFDREPSDDEMADIEKEFEGKLTEAKETPIDVARRIVKNQQYEKYKGMMLDGFTANAIMKVYDKVNDQMKAKLEKLPLPKLVSIVWKVMK